MTLRNGRWYFHLKTFRRVRREAPHLGLPWLQIRLYDRQRQRLVFQRSWR